MEATKTPQQNIALLPSPLFLGHLIPFIQLAKKLVSHHNCTVSLIIPHDLNTQKSLLQQIPAAITPVFLPPLPIAAAADLPENQHPEILASKRVIQSLPSLRHALSSLATPAAALVVDIFAPYAVDLAKELEIPAYIFYSTAAYQLSMFLDFTKFDLSSLPPEMKAPPPPSIMLPCSVLLKQDDFSDLMKDSNVEVHKWFADLTNKYLSANGIIVNSFTKLEPEAFTNLVLHHHHIPIHRVGPLIQETESDNQETECVKWLNDQPPKSVLFISFGSGGALSIDQVRELAFGLEMSDERFLWVARSPQENASAAYINAQNEKLDDPSDFLPEGFLERTKNRGLVVNSWAPQVRVLSHESTGGFVTHCGWNSILESVVFGVPMIAWPLCFEQRMNAVFLTDGLKCALRVRERERGKIVEREDIAQCVRELMEGEEGKRIQERMMDVKAAAANAMSEDGSSAKAIARVVQNWSSGN